MQGTANRESGEWSCGPANSNWTATHYFGLFLTRIEDVEQTPTMTINEK